jgi:hypothetical protein
MKLTADLIEKRKHVIVGLKLNAYVMGQLLTECFACPSPFPLRVVRPATLKEYMRQLKVINEMHPEWKMGKPDYRGQGHKFYRLIKARLPRSGKGK